MQDHFYYMRERGRSTLKKHPTSPSACNDLVFHRPSTDLSNSALEIQITYSKKNDKMTVLQDTVYQLYFIYTV